MASRLVGVALGHEDLRPLDFGVVNAKVGYERDNFKIALWGKNHLNTTYVTRTFLNGTQWYGRAGEAKRTGGISRCSRMGSPRQNRLAAMIWQTPGQPSEV